MARVRIGAGVAFAALAVGALLAESTAAPVKVGAVRVEPGTPGPETLCRLAVDLVNASDRPVTALVYRVRINGAELPVYKNHVYMERLDPGQTRTARLYNFWSTERGRPAPTDGFLTVEVSLVEARFADGDRAAVGDLPATGGVRLPFR